MIVLDTNVLSELMKTAPSPKVLTWIDKQVTNELFTTTITISEISYGINVLPNGQRRKNLESSFIKAVDLAFKHRILSFDEAAAHWYGKIMAKRKILGRPLSILDGQIAAIALTNEFSIATRNIRDFVDCDVKILNPFTDQA